MCKVVPKGSAPHHGAELPKNGEYKRSRVGTCAHRVYALLVSVTSVASDIFARITSEREGQFSWMPDRLRRSINYIHTTVVDLFSLAMLLLFFPINLERVDPKTYDPSGGPPIFLVHGFLGSSNNFLYLRRRLEKAGFTNVFTINLGHPFQSIDQYADRVNKKRKEIQTIVGEEGMVFIGHSMGGLLAEECGRKKAKEIITIGTPLEGTKMAQIASSLSEAAEEMKCDSARLKKLQSKVQEDPKTRYFHIATQVDHIVRPATSAEGPDNHKHTTLDATGHIGYLFSKRVADLIIEELDSLRPADHTPPV